MKEPTMLYKPTKDGYETVVVDSDEVKERKAEGWKDHPPKEKKK